jgi:hypothetical protein
MENVKDFTPHSPQTLQNTIKRPNRYGLPMENVTYSAYQP